MSYAELAQRWGLSKATVSRVLRKLEKAEDIPQDTVSNGQIIVSNSHGKMMAEKVLQLLALQGIDCAECPRMTYKLYALSADSKGTYERDTVVRRFRMDVLCSSGAVVYTFEFSTRPVEGEGGSCNG